MAVTKTAAMTETQTKKKAADEGVAEVKAARAKKPAAKKASAKTAAAATTPDKTRAKAGASGKAASARGSKKSKESASDKHVLVIVESPAKAKTIEKYLGPKYSVMASMGHLIDLPKSRVGIDVDHDFEPEYLTIRGKAGLLKDLQKAAKNSGLVLLASDNDREGEAIAYHIGKAIRAKDPQRKIERIAFNEITPQAIRDAVKNPREIEESKVEAQKARRVLDRLVGYNLSPLLWKKVKNGLSAGRVQSVALRLICEREKEVVSFIPEEYWSVEADFRKGRGAFEGDLVLYRGEKPALKNETDAKAVVAALQDKAAVVGEIRETEKTLKPKPPFTTSKLQQTSANRLGFTSKKTMQIAQQLYEGVNVGSTRIGLITYMRTDSTRISETAIGEVRAFIGERYPAELPPAPNSYAADGKAQDAHEAIRPTMVSYTPDQMKEHLSRDQLRLYSLIWERFVASQMTSAKQRTTSADIICGEGVFRTASSRLVEPGFYRVLKIDSGKEEKVEGGAPSLVSGEELKIEGIRPEQHFTQGPARYTDASIIKALEEQGIGRPSTYAPIISVLLDRYYVTRDNRQLVPTTLGKMISDILVESFPAVIDVGFTAGLEIGLDRVEERSADWVALIREFYLPFKKRVDEVMESLQSYRGTLDEKTDMVCEKCGKPMLKKLGRFGFFLACSGFPECRNTRSIPLAKCPRPDCGGDIVARRASKGRGREFYGCSRYPECDFITYNKPTESSCPKCGWFLVEKYDKKNGPRKVCINPGCDYLHSHEEGETEHAAQL